MTKDSPFSAWHVSTDEQRAARRLRFAVAATFPLAFMIHDGEEVLAAAKWHRSAPALLRDRFPNLPEPVVQAVSVSPQRMKNAVALVSCAVAVVTAISLTRLDRPLGVLRSAVAVFGAHSITHAAQALVLRAYTPGVASAGLLIVPYSLWAWKALNKADGAGARLAPALLKGAPPVLMLLVLAHTLAAARERETQPKH